MQSSYQLKLSDGQKDLLIQEPGLKTELIESVIQSNAEQIGYMLQAYYTREKVSKVCIVPGSINFTPDASVSLKLEYVMEEFNACSAINTEQKEKMTITIDREAGVLTLKGESWPEL